MWIYWSGYVVSFLLVFVVAVISLRSTYTEGATTADIILDAYAGMILIAVLCSFLSWAWVLFFAGYIIIGTGEK